MSNGILDSLATLKRITFPEREFDIQVAAHEADEEHFDTLERILPARRIQEKSAGIMRIRTR